MVFNWAAVGVFLYFFFSAWGKISIGELARVNNHYSRDWAFWLFFWELLHGYWGGKKERKYRPGRALLFFPIFSWVRIWRSKKKQKKGRCELRSKVEKVRRRGCGDCGGGVGIQSLWGFSECLLGSFSCGLLWGLLFVVFYLGGPGFLMGGLFFIGEYVFFPAAKGL